VTVPTFNSFNSLPPVGLMGLFQIKSDGRTPRPLDSLQFTFNADQFYLRSQEQVAFNSTVQISAQGLGATDLFTVPTGKGWLLTQCGISATTTVAQYVRAKGVAFWDTATRPVTDELVSDLSPGALAVNNAGASGFADKLPLLMPPSSTLRYQCTRLIAGPIVACSMTVRYVEIPWS